MKIFILTQPDAFYIPKLICRFCEEVDDDIQIAGAAVLKGEIAAKNVSNYIRLLGIRGLLLNGFEFARYKALDLIDRNVEIPGVYSVRGALRANDIPEMTPQSINDKNFHQTLVAEGVDLVVSVACPEIVRKSLLNLLPEGVINIHGALLPKYRGKLPSFWVLANGEKETGVTVHYMNEKLDDGPIIIQKRVPISPQDTLHSLVLKSKVGYGASALAEAVHQIKAGSVIPQPNNEEAATYFSFPDNAAIARFRANKRKIR